ncbi:hypothetical protein DIPPA_27325 [Diplonema papillatum]|nr:hypothetical protein DIPPA_27325 [Diplonema papillatum]
MEKDRKAEMAELRAEIAQLKKAPPAPRATLDAGQSRANSPQASENGALFPRSIEGRRRSDVATVRATSEAAPELPGPPGKFVGRALTTKPRLRRATAPADPLGGGAVNAHQQATSKLIRQIARKQRWDKARAGGKKLMANDAWEEADPVPPTPRTIVVKDSELVIGQLKGTKRCNETLRRYYDQAQNLLAKLHDRRTTIEPVHVPRELNKDADELSNRAMDTAQRQAAQACSDSATAKGWAMRTALSRLGKIARVKAFHPALEMRVNHLTSLGGPILQGLNKRPQINITASKR